ncbi:hypothetical protein Leryth_024743 [Lithospermum erythrorhizon]|nr:hypothetical protein Leryth_024743 [Lithospermum erythrorhizon]
MAESRKPRLILEKFVSEEECKELEFIHKSNCTVGYRPNVFSTTLSHLIATNCPHLIIPIIPLREKLREKVEEHFGCEFELFIEFTGLISWCKGASIGWHSDDNRDYLKQRDFAAVCYLNSYDADFKGGLFHFQDGEPSTLVPIAGDVALYTADEKNVHSVDEVTEGERITLTLWFTRNKCHDEDTSLISLLSQSSSDSLSPMFDPFTPLPASPNMYWFPPNGCLDFQAGFDIRYARLHVLGFNLCPFFDKSCSGDSEFGMNFLDQLMRALKLVRGDELFEAEFSNVMHILQVVQFFYWKTYRSVVNDVRGKPSIVVPLSDAQRKTVDDLKHTCLKDRGLAETFFSNAKLAKSLQDSFDWVSFTDAVDDWGAYTLQLKKDLVINLPFWRLNQSIILCHQDSYLH